MCSGASLDHSVPYFLSQSPSLTWNSPGRLGLPGCQVLRSCLCFLALGPWWHTWVFTWMLNNSGPHAYVATRLATDPSNQLRQFLIGDSQFPHFDFFLFAGASHRPDDFAYFQASGIIGIRWEATLEGFQAHIPMRALLLLWHQPLRLTFLVAKNSLSVFLGQTPHINFHISNLTEILRNSMFSWIN